MGDEQRSKSKYFLLKFVHIEKSKEEDKSQKALDR